MRALYVLFCLTFTQPMCFVLWVCTWGCFGSLEGWGVCEHFWVLGDQLAVPPPSHPLSCRLRGCPQPQPCASLDLNNHFPTKLTFIVNHLLLRSRQGRPPEERGLGGLWKKGEQPSAKLWRRKSQSHGSFTCILKVILRFRGSLRPLLFLGGTVCLQDMVWEPGFPRGSSSTRPLWA